MLMVGQRKQKLKLLRNDVVVCPTDALDAGVFVRELASDKQENTRVQFNDGTAEIFLLRRSLSSVQNVKNL